MDFKNPETSALLEKELYIFDMDGTIYLGYNVFDFAIKFINNLRANGKKILFFTNNASHTDEYYLTKLTKLGFISGKKNAALAEEYRWTVRSGAGKQGGFKLNNTLLAPLARLIIHDAPEVEPYLNCRRAYCDAEEICA